MLAKEAKHGRFLFLIDATLVSQAGKKTQNTYSTGNRGRRRAKGRRYNKKKVVFRKCHSFTFGLLITPSGIRIPFQIPHYTQEYAPSTASRIARRPKRPPTCSSRCPCRYRRPKSWCWAIRLMMQGLSARHAFARGYLWIFPANPERVYEGPKGQRPKLRSRLKDWNRLSLKTIRLRASQGKYAKYRRLSRWRVGPKLKPRIYYVHQEIREVRSVGCMQLVFSTMKAKLSQATPDDVKILMTNAVTMSVQEVIDLYSLRWQIELFFKELKSTLGFSQYSFESFQSVRAWVEIALTTVLFLEFLRIQRMRDRGLKKKERQWWEMQRLHGLCTAYRRQCSGEELHYWPTA